MNKLYLYFSAVIVLFSTLFANDKAASTYEESKILAVEKCLLENYGIDPSTCSNVLDKFSPLFKNKEYEQVLDSFIEKSEKLNISSLKPNSLVSVPTCHTVLFESDSLRICWVSAKSGDQEPPQLHPWRTLMVVIRPSLFYSQVGNNPFEEHNWLIGTYFFEPSSDLIFCKNIGSEEYNALVFEIKGL